MSDPLHIPDHPFFLGAQADSAFEGLPRTLPFSLAVDEALGLPRLTLEQVHFEALEAAYGQGSMLSTPLGKGALGKAREDVLIEGLMATLSRHGLGQTGLRLLEIGCGEGHLLARLKTMGFEMAGIEIGPQAALARDQGLDVRDAKLTPELFGDPFDAIIGYGCLEHIVDLADLLSAATACLNPGGLFFQSVPNSDHTFETCRPEELSHQHVSYFTARNSTRLLSAFGFTQCEALPTPAGNELQIAGRWDGGEMVARSAIEQKELADEQANLKAFAARFEARNAEVLDHLVAWQRAGESVGFYAGGFPFALKMQAPETVRFFDGDSEKHGRCWLGGLRPIEPPEALVAEPVDRLVICVDHYFDPIARHIRSLVGEDADIDLISLKDV